MKPGNLWFQLAHPVSQQDREQHDKQTEGKAGCVHKATFLGESCTIRHAQTTHSLKSLSVEELQMDWLRSEDLKEEKT